VSDPDLEGKSPEWEDGTPDLAESRYSGRCISLIRLVARSLGRQFPCFGSAFRGASNGMDPPPTL
jgi:hypothetical protein